MLLWFVGTALIAMWFTFRDPAIDHRLVIVGAVLPDAVDALSVKTNLMHTLAAPIVLMMGLMVCTIGRRRFRRHALALPIGIFWHSVFIFNLIYPIRGALDKLETPQKSKRYKIMSLDQQFLLE